MYTVDETVTMIKAKVDCQGHQIHVKSIVNFLEKYKKNVMSQIEKKTQKSSYIFKTKF